MKGGTEMAKTAQGFPTKEFFVGMLTRDIVPAGHSFDAFTQQDVNLIFSHINAVKRKQFRGKSAYDLFTFFNSVELAQILGISYISPNTFRNDTTPFSSKV